jgi:hypothetical protein
MAKLKPGFFIDRTDPYRVLLSTGPAAPKQTLVALASGSVCHLVDFGAIAMNTSWSVSPALFLEELNSRQFVRASQWDIFNDIRP